MTFSAAASSTIPEEEKEDWMTPPFQVDQRVWALDETAANSSMAPSRSRRHRGTTTPRPIAELPGNAGTTASPSTGVGAAPDKKEEEAEVSRFASRVEDLEDHGTADLSANTVSDTRTTPSPLPEPMLLSLPPPATDTVAQGRYYEAVIKQIRFVHQPHPELSSATPRGAWSFFIHYMGWNARYDRWCPAQDLRPWTPLPPYSHHNQHSYDHHQRSSASSPTPPSSSSSLPANKRRRLAAPDALQSTITASSPSPTPGATSATDDHSAADWQEYCALPFTLKAVLVEEWEKIHRTGLLSYNGGSAPMLARRVHDIPSPVPITKFLQHFAKKMMPSSTPASSSPPSGRPAYTSDQIQSFCQSLIQIFDVALPKCLLYPQERPQYQALLKHYPLDPSPPKKRSSPPFSSSASQRPPWAEIYGCEFLLRLLVQWPTLVVGSSTTTTTTASPSRMNTGPLWADLVVLLQKNRLALFRDGHYRPPRLEEWTAEEKAEYLYQDHGGDHPTSLLMNPRAETAPHEMDMDISG